MTSHLQALSAAFANDSPNTMSTPNIVLNVNGIEVIYNHVILVLKGVSLQVPEGGASRLPPQGGNPSGPAEPVPRRLLDAPGHS